MALGKIEFRGCRGMSDLLAPRLVTRLGLWCISLCVGWGLWKILTYDLHAYVAGVGSSFCLLCLGAVWAMREKCEILLDTDHPRPSDFRKARFISRDLRNKATWIAVYVAICALISGSAVLSDQFSKVIYEWMVYAGLLACAESAYSFLIINAWEEQLIERRDDRRLRQMISTANGDLIERLKTVEIKHSTEADRWITPSVTKLHRPMSG